MQAVILAAGKGVRLNRLTENNTKCMVRINEETIIERMLAQLTKRNVNRIIIVVGYKKEELIKYVNGLEIDTEVVFVENSEFDVTNNIYSLYLARNYLTEEDTIILDSDIIFEDQVLDLVFDDANENCAIVDVYKSWMTGMGVSIDSNNNIGSFVNENEIDYSSIKKCYKTIGIYYFTKEFSANYYIPFLNTYIKCFGKTEKYDQVLRVLSMISEIQVKAKCISNLIWYEINDIQDVDLASTLFSKDEEKISSAMLGRWGGYWRYPEYLDYFYLVTPYYPTSTIVEEMKAHFEELLIQYPSGMKVNALLAAKEFKVEPENIIIGNGAAELIKSIMENIEGVTGFVRPTFDEYPNRFVKDEVSLYVENENFEYSFSDIVEFFDDKDISNLVIVNPDNPSGNYINKLDMLSLVEWTNKKGIKLIVDESFVDFVDEENPTLIKQNILDRYTNLYVIKSISKSYGVPGLRLGVLASGDVELIAWMKKDVAIWNINSFAEFYMQICGKYQRDYEVALAKFRNERSRFQRLLNEIECLRVIPSQANYIMVELLGGMDAEMLKRKMLIDQKVFIKTLGKKIQNNKQYLRIAIRNSEDNDIFVEKLKEALFELKKGNRRE